MKKTIIIGFFLLFATAFAGAQVLNTGRTLKPGTLTLGAEPVFYEDNFKFFMHGGLGISSGFDLSFRVGLSGETYIGADLEWAIADHMSLSVGGHQYGNYGLDGTLLFDIPLGNTAYLFSGLDTDIIFVEATNEISTPFWIPAGLEIGIKNKITLLLETGIPINDEAWTIYGGGLVFYF
ncbi:MAG: hypothetical protein K9J27_10780 [Bacteroidales bacterium]|nr:hypothetical protein [Bacteroidales bacterium]MCF8333755.1 hypothetical protein [Bacteroidales bacterium]